MAMQPTRINGCKHKALAGSSSSGRTVSLDDPLERGCAQLDGGFPGYGGFPGGFTVGSLTRCHPWGGGGSSESCRATYDGYTSHRHARTEQREDCRWVRCIRWGQGAGKVGEQQSRMIGCYPISSSSSVDGPVAVVDGAALFLSGRNSCQ